MINHVAFLTSLLVAGVAGYFSVIGLATIFAGSFWPVVIMAGTLEVGKLVTAGFLHIRWSDINRLFRWYLSSAVVVLMLITSLGIFGYLSKAHSDQSSDTAQAQSIVDRIQSQIDREDNKILSYEQRIDGLGVIKVDVSGSITQQEAIRDGAWDRVQGDIDYAQGQINSLRGQISTLDAAVNDLRNKGVETITTGQAGAFRGPDIEKIDYVAQANILFEQQASQRDQIRADIAEQQDNIDKYREQAQDTINGANAEIKKLQQSSTGDADEIIAKTEEFETLIDQSLDNIDQLKDEMFESNQVILNLEREVGPIKYVAEAIYGDEAVNVIDDAVRWVIYLLIFVFDPLAVLLLISSLGLIARDRQPLNPAYAKDGDELSIPSEMIDGGNKARDEALKIKRSLFPRN